MTYIPNFGCSLRIDEMKYCIIEQKIKAFKNISLFFVYKVKRRMQNKVFAKYLGQQSICE